jgi:hypothetical protein
MNWLSIEPGEFSPQNRPRQKNLLKNLSGAGRDSSSPDCWGVHTAAQLCLNGCMTQQENIQWFAIS